MTDPADEPLEEWAARRERRRAAGGGRRAAGGGRRAAGGGRRAAEREVTGTRRVLPLAEGGRAAHVAPDAPRLLLEWDGATWATVGVARNAGEARVFLGHVPQPAPTCDAEARPPHPGLGPGRGRHRKP